MSRRSKRSQASHSQNSDDEEFEDSILSSQTGGSNTDERVNNLVRYLVISAGKNMIFRRADLAKLIGVKTGVQFQDIITETTKILKEIYGYNLLVVDPDRNSSKAFILSNCMPYMNYSIETPNNNVTNIDDEDEETEEPEATTDGNNVLLLLILSHIFMSNGAVNEASLYSFLKPLAITSNKRHRVFGDLKERLDGFIKTKYVGVEIDPISRLATYSWGIRAEKEISKMKVVQFVCKMYGTKSPECFKQQLESARQQCYENSGFPDVRPGTSMDVDDE